MRMTNFIQLCRLRGEDDPRLKAWLKKKQTNTEMKNNILQNFKLLLVFMASI